MQVDRLTVGMRGSRIAELGYGLRREWYSVESRFQLSQQSRITSPAEGLGQRTPSGRLVDAYKAILRT